MCVCVANSEREAAVGCVGVLGSSIPLSRREKRGNHSISERGRETGMLGKSRGSKREGSGEGREGGRM